LDTLILPYSGNSWQQSVAVQLENFADSDAFLEYLLAQILARQGPAAGSAEFNQAVAAATRAIALNPDLLEDRDILASLYLKSGQLQKSIQQSRIVLQKEPEDPEALYHLMQALRRTGKTEEIPDLVKRLAAAQAASTATTGGHV
jgi:tetratricopeptide (TPR) repeat protein